jgi:putative PEP-CTERM system TPR-repeat lipoprotein
MTRFKTLILFAMLLFAASTSANVSQLYENAIQSYNEDNIDAAYIHLKNALYEDPSHLPSKILMGKVLISKGFLLAALTEFNEAQEAGGDPNIIVLPLANTHLLLEEFDEVTTLSTNGLSPSNTAKLLLIQGNAYLNLEENDKAIGHYKKALAIAPDDIGILTNIAYFYFITKDEAQMQSTVAKLSELAPEDFRVLHLEGQILKSKKVFNQAHEYFERAYQANPEDPVIKRSLVSSLIQQQDYIRAQTIVEEILEQSPDDPFALLYKGRLLRENQAGDDYEAVFEELNLSLAAIPEQIKKERDELLIIRAVASYLNEDFGRAVREFEAFLAKRPNNVKAMGLLADSYIQTGQEFKALGLLENRERTIAQDKKVSLMLCNLYLNANKAFKCEQLINGLEKLYGEEPSFAFMRVRALLGLGRYPEAIELLERDFSDADHSQVLFTSVSLYAANTQYDLAIQQVDKLIETSGDDAAPKLLKTNLLIAKGDYLQAKALVESVLEQNSQSRQGRLSLARIYLNLNQYEQGLSIAEELHDENKLDLAIAILYSQLLIATGEDERALKQLTAARAITDKNPIASELLVKLYMRSGELDDALSEINHLLRAHYLVPEYLMTKSEILYELGDVKDANKQLNIIYGLWLDEANKLGFLANKQMSLGDLDGANKSLAQAIKLIPESLAFRVQLMQLYLMQNQADKAQQEIASIQKSYPNSAVLDLMRGEISAINGAPKQAYQHYLNAYKNDNNYSLALIKLYQLALAGLEQSSTTELLQKHLAREPQAYLIRNLLADLLMMQSKYDEALTHYERLVKVRGLPSIDGVLNNIANIKLLNKDTLDEALDYATQALNLNPQSANIMDTKAWILAKQAKYSESLNLMRQALALNANDPSMQYHLAYILAKLNRTSEAISELQKALNNHPEFKDRDEAQRLLDELRSA